MRLSKKKAGKKDFTVERPLIKSFCGGPGGGFFKKSPLAGSVARHLLSGSDFSVRCLTRDPVSEKAQALAKAGAEVVKGDLENPESLDAAVEGVYGVFGVTNFWEHFDKEYHQGKNLVDAVKRADVEHFVFSSLPYVNKITRGEFEIPHFDMKGQLEEYTRSLGINATFVHVAFYFENFLYFTPPQKQEDGTYAFGYPQGDTRLAAVAVEDLEESRSLYPGLQSFESWLTANKDKF